MIDILKKIGILSLITGFLVVLGNGINVLIDWNWLTTICRILRLVIVPLDYMIDTTELITRIGSSLSILILFWSARGFIAITNSIKNK